MGFFRKFWCISYEREVRTSYLRNIEPPTYGILNPLPIEYWIPCMIPWPFYPFYIEPLPTEFWPLYSW